ncbi:MAG: hypothetical protein ABSE92_13920 [Terriglobales bacterium]
MRETMGGREPADATKIDSAGLLAVDMLTEKEARKSAASCPVRQQA